MYAALVDPGSHLVLALTWVNTDGTYSFTSDISPNTTYQVILTTYPWWIGGSLTTAYLPTGWISTGEHVGAGPGSDGTADSMLLVTVVTTSVTQVNFGIVKQPDVAPTITAVPNVMHGITSLNIFVQVAELNHVDTSGAIVVKIPKDSRLTFTYNPALTVLGGTPLNNPVWSYSSDANNHIFTSSAVITGGNYSYFGFAATWNAGQTQGRYTITSQIVPYSGGETRTDNDVDAETIK